MKRFVTFGELLLSLSSAGNNRLVQSDAFNVQYVGAEANVAVSLAHFGVEAYEVSKVPAHEIGQACVNALRRYGVRTDYILRGGDRLGILYKEIGASQRPIKVIYDRKYSSISTAQVGDIDWDKVFEHDVSTGSVSKDWKVADLRKAYVDEFLARSKHRPRAEADALLRMTLATAEQKTLPDGTIVLATHPEFGGNIFHFRATDGVWKIVRIDQ